MKIDLCKLERILKFSGSLYHADGYLVSVDDGVCAYVEMKNDTTNQVSIYPDNLPINSPVRGIISDDKLTAVESISNYVLDVVRRAFNKDIAIYSMGSCYTVVSDGVITAIIKEN